MKNFFTSNNEKITEKAFSQSLLVSLFSILLCLVLLCSMTYAWFTDGTSSNCNTLKSASFWLEKPVVVRTDEEIAPASEITVTEVAGEKGTYTCTLPTNGTYLVTLNCGASTAKGHCVVKINGQEKKTAAIIGTETANGQISCPFTFQIETSTENVEIVFQAVWGVIAEPNIEKDQTYSVEDWQKSTDEPNAEATR